MSTKVGQNPYFHTTEDVDLFKAHKGLLFSHLNIRSLFNKTDTVRETFYNYDFDVITFSKRWLNEHLPDNMIELRDYNLFRKDREWIENGQTKKRWWCMYIYKK